MVSSTLFTALLNKGLNVYWVFKNWNLHTSNLTMYISVLLLTNFLLSIFQWEGIWCELWLKWEGGCGRTVHVLRMKWVNDATNTFPRSLYTETGNVLFHQFIWNYISYKCVLRTKVRISCLPNKVHILCHIIWKKKKMNIYNFQILLIYIF